MTYAQFHLAFTLPVLAGLVLAQRRPVAGVGARTAYGWLAAVVGLAVAYTTPWDNYLVYRGVWTYPPSAVVATIGYVPVEEYAFFVIQTVIAGLTYYLLRGRDMLASPVASMPAGFRTGLVGTWLAVTALGIGLLLHPDDHALYMGLILAWAGPVLAGMGWIGSQKIWDERIRVSFAITVAVLYLWIIDRIAIGIGIWDIADPYRLQIDPLGLPLEEAVFFVVTTTLCVFGLALFLPSPRDTR